MKRRDLLAACATLAGAAAAGCLADGVGSDPVDGSPTDSPAVDPTATPAGTTDRRSESPAPPSPTGSPSPSHEHAADQPDPDHEVRLSNDDDEPHTIAVTVTGPDGETVYDGTHDLDAGSEAVPYNLRQADPDGIEAFDVTAEMGDRRETVTIRTSACYGDALVYATEDGELYVTYSIC